MYIYTWIWICTYIYMDICIWIFIYGYIYKWQVCPGSCTKKQLLCVESLLEDVVRLVFPDELMRVQPFDPKNWLKHFKIYGICIAVEPDRCKLHSFGDVKYTVSV